MGEKISVGDELPCTTLPGSEFAANFGIESMRENLGKVGADWSGPKYKISLKARRDMELEKSSYNKNNPRMVELSKFPKNAGLPPPLPSGLRVDNLVKIVLDAQPDLAKKRGFRRKLSDLLNSKVCADILKNTFWWFYLQNFKSSKYRDQATVLYHQASSNFVMLVTDQLSSNCSQSDAFMSRFPFVLAQLVYVTFCWAYPQSHPKFDANFRETVFQTCSTWMNGIKYQPHHQVSKWRLGELEPAGFRNTNTKVRIAAEAHIEPEANPAGKIKFEENTRSLSFKQSSQALITANRMKRRGTVFMKKQKSQAKKIEPSKVCEFKTCKFNTAGVSPFLQSYLDSCEEKSSSVTSWQPLINRTEIVASRETKSLTEHVAESRKVVRSNRAKIDSCIREQQRYSKRLRDEWAKKSEEMNEQIQGILRSKRQTAIFAELCATHNTTARKTVPTDKILRLMKA